LIDSIIDSSFAGTADTGCDWLKQQACFTAVLAETKQFQNSFETVFFCFSFVSVSFHLCGQFYVSQWTEWRVVSI